MASWLCCCCSGREASVRPFGPQTSSEKERLTKEKECDTPEDTPGSERIMNVGLDVGSKRPSESQDDADESPTEVRAKSASGGNAPPEAAMNIEDIERLTSLGESYCLLSSEADLACHQACVICMSFRPSDLK